MSSLNRNQFFGFYPEELEERARDPSREVEADRYFGMGEESLREAYRANARASEWEGAETLMDRVEGLKHNLDAVQHTREGWGAMDMGRHITENEPSRLRNVAHQAEQIQGAAAEEVMGHTDSHLAATMQLRGDVGNVRRRIPRDLFMRGKN